MTKVMFMMRGKVWSSVMVQKDDTKKVHKNKALYKILLLLNELIFRGKKLFCMKLIVKGRAPKLFKSVDVLTRVFRANMMTDLHKPQSLKSLNGSSSLEHFRDRANCFL